MLVETSDLIPAQNQGATYFAEAEYIVRTNTPGAKVIRASATFTTMLLTSGIT
jgi:hypothetical protein